jgi:hypothetical protein
MKTQAAYHTQVRRTMEAMTDQILALQAISGLLAAIESNPINLSELSYLLDPIIEKQKALVDELMSPKNVVHLPAGPSHQSQPLPVADHPQ